jgi:hypothetical protein
MDLDSRKVVIAGAYPVIHLASMMDGRVKPGHDS